MNSFPTCQKMLRLNFILAPDYSHKLYKSPQSQH